MAGGQKSCYQGQALCNGLPWIMNANTTKPCKLLFACRPLLHTYDRGFVQLKPGESM